MNIREGLKERTLLFDGAFGTYYTAKSGVADLPEMANGQNLQLVKEIHRDYIDAGANIIRTNTFASNCKILNCTREEQEANLKHACALAKEAIAEGKQAIPNRQIFLAGDIGPIPYGHEEQGGDVEDEYFFMAKTLLDAGVDLLLFETFSDYRQLLPVMRRIKEEYPECCILLHFSVNQYGYTNAGIRVRKIFTELAEETCIDGLGLNCGVGPGHMLKIYEELPLAPDKIYSALPNASYPKLIQDRIIFSENRDYFAEKLESLAKLGMDCLGGCCGTTPEYIRQASQKLAGEAKFPRKAPYPLTDKEKKFLPRHAFYNTDGAEEADLNRKLIAVELAPPFGADDEKVLDAAYYLNHCDVDVITFPDSPSGRTRADSVLMGVKVKEKSGLTVMPHICCRDKNAIAIRSQLLGAYMNGIRNLLVVTGDPVPTLLRGNVKSVYNFDSVGLMRILQEMNEEEFAEDPFVYGGAINPGRVNVQVEIDRMKKKIDAGATFFLTQPLFAEEDIERLRRIKEAMPDGTSAKMLCGIMPLVSQKNAMFIKNEMAGIHVTEEIVARYERAVTREEGEQVGISLAKEIMEKTKDLADGYYFSIPFNRVQLLPTILEC